MSVVKIGRWHTYPFQERLGLGVYKARKVIVKITIIDVVKHVLEGDWTVI